VRRLRSKSEIRNPKSEIEQDLDWIVMRCLEKDRNRRYETAEGLAADLKRHLRDEPVLARPPGNLYRFRKMVRRNKGAFTLTSLIALTLLSGIAATSWQAIRARRAEQQERFERARAEKRLAATMRFFDTAFTTVSSALSDVIGAAGPRELLARAAVEVLDDLRQGDPPDEKSRAVLGHLYQQLAKSHGWFTGNTTGDYEAAFKAVTNAIHFRESVVTESPSDASLLDLSFSEQAAGLICFGLRQFPEAMGHFQKCHQWATQLRQQSTNSYYLIWSGLLGGAANGNIGEVLVRMGRAEEALTNYILPAMDRVRKGGNLEQSTNKWDLWGLKSSNDALGMAYHRLKRYEEALPYLREALRFGELINQRYPHSAQFSSALAVVRAEVGEVLLCLYQSTEGLQLSEAAARESDELARRDPANAGFTQVQIEVYWRSAAGCAACAGDPSASLAERRARLNQAQTHLDHAQALLDGLKSKSLRKFLQPDVETVADTIARARTLLEAKGGPE
jgi:tetratricopeptide (TPR) repeat protein